MSGAVGMGMRIGSLCSGYGGLEVGLQPVTGGQVVWHAEIDPDASRILAHHWPAVPNLGDITTADWASVEPVDILTAGYPCQPFSLAGQRKGADDVRHLWPFIAGAVGVLRPRWCFFENVAGHVTLGLDRVVGDLAALRYDAVWCLVRAADAGAPHRRERVFILAEFRDADRLDRAGGATAGLAGETGSEVGPASDTGGVGRRPGSGLREERTRRVGGADGVGRGRPGDDDRATAADSYRDSVRDEPVPVPWSDGPTVAPGDRSEPSPDPCGSGLEVREPCSQHPDQARHGIAGGALPVDWGVYGLAVARWERIVGRPAPLPTELTRKGRVQIDQRDVVELEVRALRDGVHVRCPTARDEADAQGDESVGDRGAELLGGDVAELDSGDDGGVSGHAPDAPSRHQEVKRRLSPAFVEWLMGLPGGHVTSVPGLTRAAQLRALGNGVVPQQAALAARVLFDLHDRHLTQPRRATA